MMENFNPVFNRQILPHRHGKIVACCAKILETFSEHQANIFSNFWEEYNSQQSN